jgi:tRNA-2-methylthio-N6-dimethylallyladenosine synthase
VRVFGCQQNFSDGEKLRGVLATCGFAAAPDIDRADVIIFDTCAVREHAEERVFGNVGALKSVKQDRRETVIAVVGCMTAQPTVARKMRDSYPFVDIICGTNALTELPRMLCEVFLSNSTVTEVGGETFPLDDSFEQLHTVRDNSFKASVPIMYGCDNFCSYCVVPYVRGRERSRAPEKIIAEVRALVADGVKYVLLLGQNVNSYNADKYDFARLLSELDEIDGDFWLDFMTSHPKDCSEGLIDIIAQSRHIVHRLHLPAQSGNDRVLRDMNRHYSRARYLQLARYAREKMPLMSLTTDILVGFPTETDSDFEDTLSLITDAQIDASYTFLYSPRTGTKAATLPDPSTKVEKQARFDKLLAAQRAVSEQLYARYFGVTMRVLCDSLGRVNTGVDGWYSGKSREGIIVDFMSNVDIKGQFVNVVITDTKHWAVVGKLI